MCKVLELNGKTEILSFYSVILMFKPHFPAFPFCFGYYLTKFVPRLFLESDIALIFSSVKQFLDKYSEVLSTFLETHQFHLNYGNSRLIFLYLLSVYIK